MMILDMDLYNDASIISTNANIVATGNTNERNDLYGCEVRWHRKFPLCWLVHYGDRLFALPIGYYFISVPVERKSL